MFSSECTFLVVPSAQNITTKVEAALFPGSHSSPSTGPIDGDDDRTMRNAIKMRYDIIFRLRGHKSRYLRGVREGVYFTEAVPWGDYRAMGPRQTRAERDPTLLSDPKLALNGRVRPRITSRVMPLLFRDRGHNAPAYGNYFLFFPPSPSSTR